MIQRHVLFRSIAFVAVLAALVLVRPPLTSAQEDVLPHLQAMPDITIEISTRESSFAIHGYRPPFGGCPMDGFEDLIGEDLSWDGTRFSMDFTWESQDPCAQGSSWQIAGQVAPGGQAVLELTASQSLHWCSDCPGTEIDSYEEAFYRLSGAIPLVGTESFEDPFSGGRWCYKYAVTGADVGDVIQEARHTGSTLGPAPTLIYPPDGDHGLPDTVEVHVCGAGSPPSPATATPAAKGLWQLRSREVLEPTSAKVADLLFPCDLTLQEEWSPRLSVEEASATMQIEVAEVIAQDCIGPGCPSVTLSSVFSWTPPPQTLVPGGQVALSAAIDSVGFSEPYYGYSKNAWMVLYQDLGPIDAPDVSVLGLNYVEGEEDSTVLGQRYDGQWEIPPGAPGDSLALGIDLRGPANCDRALIFYHYGYVALDTTPEPLPDDADEAPLEEDSDLPPAEEDESAWSPPEEEPDAVPPEALEEIIAGLGSIGTIPGPEGLTEALAGIALPAAVLSALTALGYLAGGGYGPGPGGPSAGPPGGSPGEITLTDALGNQFDYEWDPDQGGYINPQTGGMLDGTLWNEYNRNLAANRAFSDRERERLEKRETAFDRRADWYATDRQRERREGLEGALRDLEERGYALGADGARAAAHAGELARRVRAGETISENRALAIERFVRNREAGRTMADMGEHGQVTNWDVGYATAAGIARNIITARNEDGSTSWAGLAVRIGVGVATLGSSEYAFIPASAAYTYSDGVARGQSRSEAALWAVGGATLEVLAGKAFQGIFSLGGRVLGAAGQFADDVAPGVSNYVRTGVRGLGRELRQVGRWLGIGGQPALTAAEKNLQWRVVKAVAEEADDDICRLYRGNGRELLGALERKGGLTTRQAQGVRQLLSKRLNAHFDDGMEAAMEQFHKDTGIHPQEVLLGDSGSTARGGPFSVGNSDFDVTAASRFSRADVARYRAQHGLGSDAEALEQLTQRFHATYKKEVKRLLHRDGLTMDEAGVEIFDRIRNLPPGGDVYPFGYSNARQSVQGRARVYRPGHRPYNTSGDALVDQNVIELGRAGHQVPADPVRMNAQEFRQVVRLQVAKANKTDGTSLAKALDRAREPMRRLGMPTSAMDTQTHGIAQQIRGGPQQQARILGNNGLTEPQFVERARAELMRFDSLLSD